MKKISQVVITVILAHTGWSVAELARRSGLHYQTVGGASRGKSDLRIETLIVLLASIPLATRLEIIDGIEDIITVSAHELAAFMRSTQ